MKNTNINPRNTGAYGIQMMRLRSERIQDVQTAEQGKGGASDNKGNCFVPEEETATARTIRMHEALHVDFTPTKFRPKDMLDQALEDARLHSHCAKTVTAFGDGARRDEKTIAIRDLRKVSKTITAAPIDALCCIRAMSILRGEHSELVSKACSRLGSEFEAKATEAIRGLASTQPGNSKAWKHVRSLLSKYFREDFRNDGEGDGEEGNKGKDAPQAEKQDNSSASKGDGESEPKDSEESKPEESKPEESKPEESKTEDEDESEDDEEDKKDADDDSGGDAEDDGDSDDSSKDDNDSEDSNGGDSSDSGEESEPESESKSEPESESKEGEDEAAKKGDVKPSEGKMAPPAPVKKHKPAPPRHEDEYTASLAPDFDSEAFAQSQALYPMALYIRRLDVGTNSIDTIEGQRNPRMVASGAKIVARKLAVGMTTPGVRIFSKTNSSGGGGSVLIDASGSMSLTDDMLKGFLATAPMLTLGFYNAPHDNYSKIQHGNIFVYAANGRRAKTFDLMQLRCAEDEKAKYGWANLIDYQAIAWLLKQPAPRYLITDGNFTGPWSSHYSPVAKRRYVRGTGASENLLKQAKSRGLLTQVYTIAEMQAMLDKKARVR